MLSWFRVHASAAAAGALLAFVAASGAYVSHAGHDDAVAVAHDASAHRFDVAPDNQAAASHRIDCLACSWARVLRQRATAVFVVAPPVERGVVISLAVTAAWSPVQAAQPPLRAPPSSPVSA